MRRLLSLVILITITGVSLAAQSTAGWKVRADRSTSAADPDAAGKIQFMAMGAGFHAVNPQAAVYWHASNTAKGNYTLRGTFILNEPSGHTNYYGLVFGGSGLDGPQQTYLYFLVAQDGTFLVKQRIGDAKTENVVGKTAHAAIAKPDASGKSTNNLEVRVQADKVDYVVNGTVVGSSPKAGLTTDGLWGMRVNHLLNVQMNGVGLAK
jgi:hypothetical protein